MSDLMCSRECGNDVDYPVCAACSERDKELAFKRGHDKGFADGKTAETPKAKQYRVQRAVIALRCGVHEGTVREAQKAAGLYVRRGASGSIPKQDQQENA